MPRDLTSRIWGEAPAPPQRQVALPPETVGTPVASASPSGLSKYFPGLRRSPEDAPNVAAITRASWFSFARRPKATQFYMTDARPSPNQGMAGASVLPVTLQVPTRRPSDSAVTPAKAETITPATDLLAPSSAPVPEKAAGADTPPTSGEPEVALPKPAEQEANPSPATEPKAAVADPTPEIPPVDPRERPRLASPAGLPAPSAPTPSAPRASGTEGRKADGHAMKAYPATPESATTSEATETMLTAFFHKVGSTVRKAPHAHTSTVHATPQSLPSPQVGPRAKPSPQVTPTSQVGETAHDCVCENCGAKIGKKPCILKRMCQAVFSGKAVARVPATPMP